ncbi:MAG: tRNA (N(6)-L-threonylcarbamoyladenosine(37)-C(2))-methylthiotransferase MtaB [Alphaproteobacteria bacterium]|nr:tRNA (N(6)-L-threonylcarbamoyladenosine(37)-C(2))-methylthiotransferase MtaB [Alphaproteobacteria bacterium]
MKSIEVQTFGCRLNTYESEVMRSLAQDAGLENAIIFNTCSVTNEAERQARQAIRKARKENPNVQIFVTGCAAQIKPEFFAAMPEVDRVIGNHEKMTIESFMPLQERVLVNDIMSVKETATHLISGFEGHARAFIQVQNGCDHRCTFCSIPYGRGNSRSVPIPTIVTQIQKLLSENYNEIVLTGVDITSYGSDLPGTPNLGQMIRRVLNLVPDLKRLRLSSLDPVEVDDDLFDLIGTNDRLLPHLHLSLQAGDDLILKRMKRRHLRQDVINFVEKTRKLRADIVFGADVIAGFPTESDEMFENTYNLIKDLHIPLLHIFPYSPRPGTPAAKMPQVVSAIRKERAQKLRDLGDVLLNQELNAHIGKKAIMILEKGNEGKEEHFLPVQLLDNSLNFNLGQEVHIDLIAQENQKLIGKVINVHV